MPLLLLSGFALGRDQVSIRDRLRTLYICSAGAASDRGPNPVTTANEAYGMHSTLPVSMDENHLPSAGPWPVYERINTNV